MNSPLLIVRDTTVSVSEAGKRKTLIDKVSFQIPALSIMALVGESGSGKTTTGFSILRLLATGLEVDSGTVIFEGKNLLSLSEDQMRPIRGGKISMVFQEPLNAFNPVFTIGYQVDEVMRFHTKLSRPQRQERILELFNLVGLSDPRRMAGSYPHQLSGGMRQRAMIAQAIAANPKLIIADEPTSNLDVTLQARIIELFQKLKDELSLSILLITHDLGMVGHVADEMAVMSRGKIIECGPTKEVLNNPREEYTKQLMNAFEVS